MDARPGQGALQAILRARVDPRPSPFVLMAATPTTPTATPLWLAPAGPDGAGQAAYGAGIAPLDPIGAAASAAPAALLCQFGRADIWIAESSALEFYAAAGEPKRLECFVAEHPLYAEASASRLVWLRGRLRLQGSTPSHVSASNPAACYPGDAAAGDPLMGSNRSTPLPAGSRR